MTTPVAPAPGPGLDVRTLLLRGGGVDRLRDHLRDVVRPDAAPRGPRLSSRLWATVVEQVAEASAGLLDVDLGAAAVAGWRTHGALVAAARETRGTPGLTVVVELAEHDLLSTWRPRVDVVVAGTTVAHLALELTVALHVVGLHAVVQAARLTRLGGGEGEVTATLSVGGQCLLQEEAPFDARLSVPLGDGVPLLGRAGPVAPVDQDQGRDGRV